jgi:hypothetical protein
MELVQYANVESGTHMGACRDQRLLDSLSFSANGGPPSPNTTSKRNTDESSVLRYILVNDANLKTQAYCAQCGTKIGQQYVRETGSRSVFCDFACYGCVVEKWAPCLGGSEERKFVCSEPMSR